MLSFYSCGKAHVSVTNPELYRSLVMMPLCSAFTAADKTDALAASNITKMIPQEWGGTNVALCCCDMNMPLAGRAKFADCNEEGH